MRTLTAPASFASTYGSGNYNTSNYNGTDVVTTTTGTTSASGGGTLSDTGIVIGLIVGVSAAVLLAALVVRIWRRPRQVMQEVTMEEGGMSPAAAPDSDDALIQ